MIMDGSKNGRGQVHLKKSAGKGLIWTILCGILDVYIYFPISVLDYASVTVLFCFI